MTGEEALDRRISNMDGESALPRSNGELICDSPWESRAFGIAVALHGDRRFDWEEFRAELIDAITRADAGASETSDYQRWLTSLESVLVARGLLSKAEVEGRVAEYASDDRSDDDY